jgi:hypothetical protein
MVDVIPSSVGFMSEPRGKFVYQASSLVAGEEGYNCCDNALEGIRPWQNVDEG